jgi:glutathione S-transferase
MLARIMTEQTEPVLYSFRRCPYAVRARMALLLSGIVCEIREVKLSAKPFEMIAVSPKATVPVLVLTHGKVIDESLDIMRWALMQHDPEGWLAREDGSLIRLHDDAFKYHLDGYKYPHRTGSDARPHRAAGLALLNNLEHRLAKRAHLCGDSRGLTDVAILPFVRQFAETDRSWFDAQLLPGVQRWLALHCASPLFAAAMVRYSPWKAGDATVYLATS